jgi:effector-binding domain-containing protein
MTYEIHLADLQQRPAAVVAAHVELPEIAEFLGGAFAEVMATLGEQGLRPAGPPFGRYVPTDGGFDVEAGFPVDRPVAAQGRVVPADLPGGTVAYTVHSGAYDEVGAAYEATADWLTDNGLVATGGAWENYLDGPEVPRPRTEVFLPCASVTPRPAETYLPRPGRSGHR